MNFISFYALNHRSQGGPLSPPTELPGMHVRNAESQTPLQTYLVRPSGDGIHGSTFLKTHSLNDLIYIEI